MLLDTMAMDTTAWDTTAWDTAAMELGIMAMLLDTTSDSLPSQKKLYMPTNLLLKRKLLKWKLLKRLKRLSSTATTDTAALDPTAWDTTALDTTVWDTAALDTTAWDASAMELDIVAMLLDTTSDSLPSQKKLYMPTNLLLKRKLLKRKLLKRLKRL